MYSRQGKISYDKDHLKEGVILVRLFEIQIIKIKLKK